MVEKRRIPDDSYESSGSRKKPVNNRENAKKQAKEILFGLSQWLLVELLSLVNGSMSNKKIYDMIIHMTQQKLRVIRGFFRGCLPIEAVRYFFLSLLQRVNELRRGNTLMFKYLFHIIIVNFLQILQKESDRNTNIDDAHVFVELLLKLNTFDVIDTIQNEYVEKLPIIKLTIHELKELTDFYEHDSNLI
jgi:hypothetical protein